jgi:DNA-binding Lrp family transcriptional regulator
MLKAWVLIQTEVGRAGEVAAAVTAIDGVELSEVTAGPFDVIAKVQASNLDALGRLIVSRVQGVPGTLRTLTCPRPGPDPGQGRPAA